MDVLSVVCSIVSSSSYTLICYTLSEVSLYVSPFSLAINNNNREHITIIIRKTRSSYHVNIVKILGICAGYSWKLSARAAVTCRNVGDTLRLFIAKHLKPRNIGRTLHVPQAAVITCDVASHRRFVARRYLHR